MIKGGLSFLLDHWYPCFGLLVIVYPGSQVITSEYATAKKLAKSLYPHASSSIGGRRWLL